VSASDVRGLFDYTEWAHRRILDTVRTLSGEQYTRVLVSSYPTIRETLSHMVFAEWLWLQRLNGSSPTARPDWATDPPLATLESILASVAAERRKFLDALDDAALDRPLGYSTMNGQSFTNRLGDILLHVVNHASYHRGQVVTMIRQVGGVPPNTDLIAFRRG
jgi:uncharacterized damage-inducible protein DinB